MVVRLIPLDTMTPLELDLKTQLRVMVRQSSSWGTFLRVKRREIHMMFLKIKRMCPKHVCRHVYMLIVH